MEEVHTFFLPHLWDSSLLLLLRFQRLHDIFERENRKLSVIVGISLKDYSKTAEDVAEALEEIAR